MKSWNSVCGAVSGCRPEYSAGRGDDALADFQAAAGDEVEHARREAGFDAQADQLRSDDGRVVRRLEQDGVAAHDGGAGHAAKDGEREIPRRNQDADSGITANQFGDVTQYALPFWQQEVPQSTSAPRKAASPTR